MRTLVICPSRGRIEKCERMVKSFRKTTHSAEMVIRVDEDDPDLASYLSFECPAIPVIVGQRKDITTMINETFQLYKLDYDFFSVTNDDFFYQTKNWDLILGYATRGFGIVYGNDGIQGERIPTTSVISANLVHAVGWLQMPDLIGLYGDNVWKDIGQALGCLYYVPEVEITHMHPLQYREEKDDTFKNTNSQERYRADYATYLKWKKNDFPALIDKIYSSGLFKKGERA